MTGMVDGTQISPPQPAPEVRVPLLSREPRLRLRGRPIVIVKPNPRDPRLKLAAIIISLQVLGQTVLDFKLSIAQILVSVGLCALIEVSVVLWRDGILAWPGSAMLTGNGVAFILRTNGTRHGDWWSLNGIEFFVLAAVLSLLSKYLIRPGGRHVFNPSNVGLVWTLLVIGPTQVFPQYLWWGPVGVPVVLALCVILLGAVWILRSVHMWGMAAAFAIPFAALVGAFALGGRSFYAIWHSGPVSGMSYWSNIVLSPEVMVFVFFMMSDPMTAPRLPAARLVYGSFTALVAAALLYFQNTEFGIKLAILSSLTVACALVPLIERSVERIQHAGGKGHPALPSVWAPAGWKTILRDPVLVAVAVISVAAPLNTAALANDTDIVLIERGLTGDPDPQ